ncbi:MAG: hypothetical protein KF845_13620 [Cyclobacteriaceae bacterium]|nr:hypothetical protein [Cyclobacteriaceae bacterium]
MKFKRIRFGLFLAVFALFLQANAQVGNEWIQFNQFYYKIPVAQDGLYRVTYSDLQLAGFPVGSVDPRRLQLFHRGIEQAIYIEGEADAVFHATDYIEFFGRKNDGTPDTELYKPASAQPHTYYNLFSDTTAYFLTYNNLAVPGKRIPKTWEVNVTNIPQETVHTNEVLLVNAQQPSDGIAYGPVGEKFVRNTFFDIGEGWTGTILSQNQTVEYVLDGLTLSVPAAGVPQLEVMVAGRAEIITPHRVEIYAGPNTSGLRLLGTHDVTNFNVHTFNLPLAWTDISADGKLTVRMRLLAVGTAARASVSYIKINYPQNFDATGVTEKYFQLNENVFGKSFVNITNVPANSRLLDVTDPANVIWYQPPAATFNPVISNTQVSRKLLLTNVVRSVTGIKRVNFRNITPAQHDYIVISHPSLMKPAGEYSDVVRAYAGYRASEDGGLYDTLVVDIHQLYNQFNYGEISPLAIHRFMKYMVDNGSPTYLFIIGKGLDWSHNYHRNPTAPAFNVYKDLVPSAGKPASDMYYTIGLGSSQYEPAVPTGRISTTNPLQVASYLNKVKEMEALPFDDLWRKRIIHLSGGLTEQETRDFRLYLEDYKDVAEGYYLGGNIRAQAKNTTNVGELINISQEVNNGLNLITFFGHSSPETNDFEVGFVTNPALGYNNPGKYPMFLINGCNAADFFTTATRFGEDWVLAASKGATGFMAHTSYGYSNTLRFYSRQFYNVAFGDSVFIRKGVGDIQREVARRYMLTQPATEVNLTQISQMLLLGDPAVNVFGAAKPDYEVNNANIFATSNDSEPITALSESFTLNMITQNFGRAREDSLHVRVTRIFNDNSTEVYDTLYPPVLYRDTLAFIIRQEPNKGFGNNIFQVEVDPFDMIQELNNDNNTASYNLFVPLNITRNLFPYDYAIINQPQVTLTFSSTDILGIARNFDVQIDTVNTFDSPYLKSFTVNGVIASHQLELLAQDSLAYYWRTRFTDPQEGEIAEWVTSSFNYIHNSPEGWAQLHFPQYLKNESVGLVKDASVRLLNYVESALTLDIHTFGSNHPAPHTDVSIKIDNAEYNPAGVGIKCRNNTINLVAFDKQSIIPYTAVLFNPFDGRACGRRPQVINSFTAAQLQTGLGNDIYQYMLNVPEGDSVVLFTIGDPGVALWSVNVKQQFEALGISQAQLNSVQPGEPVVIYTRKGAAPGQSKIFRPASIPANVQELTVSGTITGRFDSGTMTSVLIGPAQQWQQLVTHVEISEQPQTDVYSFDVIGVNLEGEETQLLTGVNGTVDLSGIDAEDYPYLRLRYNTQDAINLTPPQLNQWLVFYTPVAEGVLIFNGSTAQQTLQEGEVWRAPYSFQNISQQVFADSLTVQLEVFNQTNRNLERTYFRIKAPAPSQTTDFHVQTETLNRAGLNDVNVFVNPRILPEQYYENNVLKLNQHLNIMADVFNPVLDVTVDGRHLTNGDFVSVNPVIAVKLWDENSVIKKTSTEGMQIRLTWPGAATATAITFDRDDIVWFPQTDTEYFRILFTPENLPEGDYVLEVEARDARNNSSGATPYRIEFKVVNENNVLLLAPYPNPSNGIVQFDLMLTGELPDYVKLNIITPTGASVLSFEYTTLHVGTNRIVWEGKDNSGNDLPSGLYIYQMQVIKNNLPVLISTPAGQTFFKRGYGRVLLRR